MSQPWWAEKGGKRAQTWHVLCCEIGQAGMAGAKAQA